MLEQAEATERGYRERCGRLEGEARESEERRKEQER